MSAAAVSRRTTTRGTFPRVAGTFKEREGFHGCQMPEQLLGRIIRCCSNPLDIVVDPFGGSGTTFAVAKKLGRRWIGFELSKEYVTRINKRLEHAHRQRSARRFRRPAGQRTGDNVEEGETSQRRCAANRIWTRVRRKAGIDEELRRGLLSAFKETHQGFALDRVLADPELSGALADRCRDSGIEGLSGSLESHVDAHAQGGHARRTVA